MKSWGKILMVVAILIAAFITIGIYSSREVLSTFEVLNQKIEKQNTQSLVDSDRILSQIQNDTLSSKVLFLKNVVQEFHDTIEVYKGRLLEGVGEDYSKASSETTLFFKEDIITEEGRQFLKSFQELQAVLIENTPPEEAQIVEQIHLLYPPELLTSQEKGASWLRYHFEGFPVVSSVTKLTSIQHDVEVIKNKIFASYLRQKIPDAQ